MTYTAGQIVTRKKCDALCQLGIANGKSSTAIDATLRRYRLSLISEAEASAELGEQQPTQIAPIGAGKPSSSSVNTGSLSSDERVAADIVRQYLCLGSSAAARPPAANAEERLADAMVDQYLAFKGSSS